MILASRFSLHKCAGLQHIVTRNVVTATQRSADTTTRPYEDIPAPPGGWLPVIGHTNYFVKKPHGFARSWKNVAEMKDKFVPAGVEMIRLNMPLSNPEGNGKLLLIFDPADIQQVYRTEGKYPNRGPGFAYIKFFRSRRPDLFSQTTGLLTEEGEDWQKIRSQVQQDMMRPKSAMFYLDELQKIGDEFVAYIRRESNQRADGTIPDFLLPCHRYALESITAIALNTRLGCLEPEIPPKVETYMKSIDGITKTFPRMIMSFPFWKYFPPRLNSLFREAEDHSNTASDFVKEQLKEAAKRLKGKLDYRSDDGSVLEKLIRRNGQESEINYVMALDMVTAGIDTTGNTLAFLIYNLSRNPEKQQKLREEAQGFGSGNLTVQDVGKMKYFRACLNESMRILPTIPYTGRLMPHDSVLRGYNIPAGTLILWSPILLGKDPELFPNPDKFIPERWIEDKDKIHPFAVRQFGHGPRMCIGKRFAELELQLAISKLVTSFEIEWAADYDIDTLTELINVPDNPMAFKFNDLKEN